MKPSFALNLSHDGIGLLHRVKAGWRLVGEVMLDDPGFVENLGYLRRTAVELSGGQFACKIIIPNSQILYRQIDALGATDARREQVIRQALDGATPYAIDDLTFAWCDAGAGLADVAVVARQTLDEAEEFALEHRFNPVSFVAVPEAGDFTGEPFFGQAAHAAKLLDADDQVEPDREPITFITAAADAMDGGPENSDDAPTVAQTDPPTADDLRDDDLGEVTAVEIARDDMASVDDPDVPDELAEIEEEQFENLFQEDATEDAAADNADESAIAEKIGADITDTEIQAAESAATGDETTEGQAAEITGPAPTLTKDVVALPDDPAGDQPAPQDAPAQTLLDGTPSDPDPARAETASQPDNPETEIPAFSSRRVDGGSSEPLRLDNMSARIGLDGREFALGHDNTNPDAEITPLSMTAAQTADDDRPRAITIPPAPAFDTDVGPHSDTSALTATRAQSPDDLTAGLAGLAATAGGTHDNVGRHRGFLVFAVVAVAIAVATTLTLVWTDSAPTSSVAAPVSDTDIVSSEALSLTAPDYTIQQNLSFNPTGTIDAEIVSLIIPDVSTELLGFPSELGITDEPSVEIQTEMTPEQAAAHYAATGIWPLDPIAPIDPDADDLESLYIASIDPVVIPLDAVALPSLSGLLNDENPDVLASPPPAGTAYTLDERGFVVATAAGALTPDGVLVHAGPPSTVPPRRVDTLLSEAESGPSGQQAQVDSRLAKLRPAPRPANLLDAYQKSRLGGRTLAELAKIRPARRPVSAQELAAPKDASPTKLAVAASARPASRPRNFSRNVQILKATRATIETKPAAVEKPVQAPAATVAAVAPSTPTIPSRASVAREATVKNAIHLNKVNLIGVYGSSSQRRALVRLSNGRYVKVQIGDRIDGGKVATISNNELRYIKRGKNVTLTMPKS